MRPWLLFFVLLLSVGEVYSASILDGVKVEVEPPMIYPGEEVNVTFTAWNPTDSRHILVIKYGGFPEEFEAPSTTAVLILEPGETESETLRFRARPNIRVKNYFPIYDLIDEAYDASGRLVYKNATGNKTGPSPWHVIGMYDPVIRGLRSGTTYNVSMDDKGVNVSLELVNQLNRTHRVFFSGKDLEEREFLLEPGTRIGTSFRLEAPAEAAEYNFTFTASEEFYNGSDFASLDRWEYKIEYRRQTLSEKLLAFLEGHPWVIQAILLVLGLLILWILRTKIKKVVLAWIYKSELALAYFFYLRQKYLEILATLMSKNKEILATLMSKNKEISLATSLGIVGLSRYLLSECKRLLVAVLSSVPVLSRCISNFVLRHKRFLATASSVLLIDLLVFIKYPGHGRLQLSLVGNTTLILAFLAIAFVLRLSNDAELAASQRLRDISPRVLILDFLLLLLLAAYLISFRSEAGARAVADYAFYVLVVAVALKAHQFWREGR